MRFVPVRLCYITVLFHSLVFACDYAYLLLFLFMMVYSSFLIALSAMHTLCACSLLFLFMMVYRSFLIALAAKHTLCACSLLFLFMMVYSSFLITLYAHCVLVALAVLLCSRFECCLLRRTRSWSSTLLWELGPQESLPCGPDVTSSASRQTQTVWYKRNALLCNLIHVNENASEQ
jgi:hypothetical protein